MSNGIEGTLTPMQHEIMDAVWEADSEGISTSEIWQHIGKQRSVARTTILNQVDRLEKRGWLERQKHEGSYRYRATLSRDETESRLTNQFVNHFFRGSASRLVASLFGSERISETDVEEIRALLARLPEENSGGSIPTSAENHQ